MFFKYKAKNKQGLTITGFIEANNNKQAISLLRSQSVYVLSLRPVGSSIFSEIRLRFNKISFTNIVHFTRQLSTMINAGLSLTSSLKILTLQSSNPAFVNLIKIILKDIESGSSFTRALEKYPQYFSSLYTSLIRTGEVSGQFPQVLERLSENLEKQREFKQKITSAMIYPIIIISGMIVIMFIMMTFVVPKLIDIYKNFDAKLPWNTLLLIAISNLFVKFWWLMIIIAIISIIFFRRWKKTRVGGLLIDNIIFKIPIIGTLYQQITLTELTRTLGILVGTGIPIIEGLNIVSQSVGSPVYRNDLIELTEKVEKGQPIGVQISQNPHFPPIAGQMMTVGEETGKLDETLSKLASYFEIESEYTIKNLTTAMEPLIMIILGLGVGFMIISVILPIYNLTQSL